MCFGVVRRQIMLSQIFHQSQVVRSYERCNKWIGMYRFLLKVATTEVFHRGFISCLVSQLLLCAIYSQEKGAWTCSAYSTYILVYPTMRKIIQDYITYIFQKITSNAVINNYQGFYNVDKTLTAKLYLSA